MAAPTPTARLAFLGGPQGDNFMGFYLDNYKGEVFGSSFDVTEELQRLPDNPCKFVMLANWNAGADTALSYTALSGDNLYENAGDELYYGFRGVVVAQLFPSQSSGLLPVSNTNQIVVRARAATFKKLWYAWFV